MTLIDIMCTYLYCKIFNVYRNFNSQFPSFPSLRLSSLKFSVPELVFRLSFNFGCLLRKFILCFDGVDYFTSNGTI